MENKKEKTRNLSAAEYFLVVQKEYLIAEFRKKIYFSKKDRAYYQRVMNGKRKKIEEISKRNRLDNIFNNDAKMEEMRNELFDRLGKPKFELSDTDIENYYAVGNEFSFHGDIWILDQVNSDGTLTLYSAKLQQYENADKDEVCRIL
jgi:hypothetical protein